MLYDVPAIFPLVLSAWQALVGRPQTDFPGHQLLRSVLAQPAACFLPLDSSAPGC